MTDNPNAVPEMGPPALPIDPELYQETLVRLQMQAICVDEVSCWCHREGFSAGDTELRLDTVAEDSQSESEYNMFVTYGLEGIRDEESILKIKAKYRLIFSTTTPVPAGFFEVFQELNLRLTTFPYFRELVSAMTGRMQLPVLTLPLNIIPPIAEERKEP